MNAWNDFKAAVESGKPIVVMVKYDNRDWKLSLSTLTETLLTLDSGWGNGEKDRFEAFSLLDTNGYQNDDSLGTIQIWRKP